MNRFFRAAYFTTLADLTLTLLAVFIWDVRMPVTAFLCLLSGLLIAMLPDIFHRFSGKEAGFAVIGALLALLGFLPIVLMRCPVGYYIAHGVGVSAGCLSYVLRRQKTTYDAFTETFKLSVILLFIVLSFLFLILAPVLSENGTMSFGMERITKVINNIVPLLILALVAGILLLRGLRSEQGGVDERTFNRRQRRDLLIFGISVGFLYAIGSLRYVTDGLRFLFNEAIVPAFKWIAKQVASLLAYLYQGRISPEYADELIYPQETAAPVNQGDQMSMTEHLAENADRGDVAYNVTVYVILTIVAITVVILLILLLRKIVKKVRARKGNRGYPNEIVEEIAIDESQAREEPPKKRSEDPRERIRYLYGEFLRYLNRRQVSVRKTNTCGEIEKHAKVSLNADSSDISDLTDLYEQARYRRKTEPSDADASRMKTLFGRIRKGL